MAGLAETRTRSTELDRRRMSALLRVAAAAGRFSPKLADAVARATPEEVAVMTDLVDRGLSIPELVTVLQGAHVLVGDEELYERWIFPTSRRRMSSHHRTVDKRLQPDYGIDGPLVRESLHGKASVGTWMQLERTRANFHWGQRPTWSDIVHLRDYVLYRITGKNVGPWGLSAIVDTRPLMLRPPNTTTGRAAQQGLAAFAQRRALPSMTTQEASRWADLLTPDAPPIGPAGDSFAAPTTDNPQQLLPTDPFGDDLGPGLFGSLSLLRTRVRIRRGIAAHLDVLPPSVAPEGPGTRSERVELSMGRGTLVVRGEVHAQSMRPVFFGMEGSPS